MLLHHFTNKQLNKIKVNYFGSNSYSFREKINCSIKRSFFYSIPIPQEYRFKNSRYHYIVNIPYCQLYDLRTDKENLKIQFKNNIENLLQYIKNKYTGVIYNVGFDVIILFKDTIPIKEIKNEK